MAVNFNKTWNEEIEEVTSLPEFQVATIEIRNNALLVPGAVPDMITTFDQTFTGNPVVWTGRARIANARSSLNTGGATSFDPTSMKAITVQVPWSDDFPRVRRGWEIKVIQADHNKRLLEYILTVDSDVQSANPATITLSCTINVESDANWTP